MANRLVAAQLTDELQRSWGRPLTVVGDPVPMTGGFSSALFSFTVSEPSGELEHLVLRLLEPGHQAQCEQIILSDVAEVGYPTTAPLLCGDASSAFERPYTIMRRLEGKPAVRLSGIGTIRAIRETPSLVANAMARLHDLDPAPVAADLAGHGISEPQLGVAGMVSEIEASEPRGDAIEALVALRELTPEPSSSVVVHGDLHALNLWQLPDGQIAVLDWERATIGPPELDVARAALMLSLVPGEIPGAVRPVVTRFGRRSAGSFLRNYAQQRTIDAESLPWYRALHSLRVLTTVITRPADDSVAAQWRPIARQLALEVETVTGEPLQSGASRR